jgi:hypothetical protein
MLRGMGVSTLPIGLHANMRRDTGSMFRKHFIHVRIIGRNPPRRGNGDTALRGPPKHLVFVGEVKDTIMNGVGATQILSQWGWVLHANFSPNQFPTLLQILGRAGQLEIIDVNNEKQLQCGMEIT